MKTDEYLYGKISWIFKFLQKTLANYKIKQAYKLKAKLCSVPPKQRDITRYLAVDKAIKFWQQSKEW